jgi:hypothetical protein
MTRIDDLRNALRVLRKQTGTCIQRRDAENPKQTGGKEQRERRTRRVQIDERANCASGVELVGHECPMSLNQVHKMDCRRYRSERRWARAYRVPH